METTSQQSNTSLPPDAPQSETSFDSTQTTPASHTTSSQKLKISFAILLTTIITLGTVFIAYQSNETKQAGSTPTTSITPTAPLLSTSSTTENWKNYANTKYGFELKYPTGWLLNSIDVPHSDNDYSFNLIPQNKSTDKLEVLNVQIMKGVVANYFYNICCKNKPYTTEFNESRWVLESKTLEGMLELAWVIGNENRLALFSFGVGVRDDTTQVSKPEDIKSEVASITQILSTFKFIENTEAETPDIWEMVCQDDNFKVLNITAEPGDGATNLARKAITEYLNIITLKNIPESVSFSSSEMVYAEDYVRKNFTFSNIKSGLTYPIPCDIVEEAALKSRLLSISQNQNLDEYSEKVQNYKIRNLINQVIEETTPEGGIKPQIFTIP